MSTVSFEITKKEQAEKRTSTKKKPQRCSFSVKSIEVAYLAAEVLFDC